MSMNRGQFHHCLRKQPISSLSEDTDSCLARDLGSQTFQACGVTWLLSRQRTLTSTFPTCSLTCSHTCLSPCQQMLGCGSTCLRPCLRTPTPASLIWGLTRLSPWWQTLTSLACGLSWLHPCLRTLTPASPESLAWGLTCQNPWQTQIYVFQACGVTWLHSCQRTLTSAAPTCGLTWSHARLSPFYWILTSPACGLTWPHSSRRTQTPATCSLIPTVWSLVPGQLYRTWGAPVTGHQGRCLLLAMCPISLSQMPGTPASSIFRSTPCPFVEPPPRPLELDAGSPSFHSRSILYLCPVSKKWWHQLVFTIA